MNLRNFRRDKTETPETEAQTPDAPINDGDVLPPVEPAPIDPAFEEDVTPPVETVPTEDAPSPEARETDDAPAEGPEGAPEAVPAQSGKAVGNAADKLAELWEKLRSLSLKASEDRYFTLPESGKPLPDILTVCRLVFAVALILASVFIKGLPDWAVLLMRVLAAAVAGYDLVISFVEEIRRKSLLFESLPVLLAVVLAFFNKMSMEAALAAVIFRLAVCLRNYVFCKAEKHLMDGASLPKPTGPIKVGDSFMAEAGMTIPTDCVVIQGSLTADLGFALGERAEKSLKQGDLLPAGSVCLGGTALVEIQGLPEDTVSHAVSETMRTGYRTPSTTEKKTERYSVLFTPILLFVCVVLLIVMPLSTKIPFGEVLRRVISILAVASPCGILVSIPIACLASMSVMRRSGVAFKTAAALDSAARAGALVFDKTGTITADRYTVSTISTDKMDPKTFLRAAAHASSISDGPIARAIIDACGEPLNPKLISSGMEFPGWGVSVKVDKLSILLGTSFFMDKYGIEVSPVMGEETRVYMAVNGILAGFIALHDSMDPAARNTVKALADAGIDSIAMVSEDSRDRDGKAASEAGIAEYHAECTEEEKARHITEFRIKTGPGKTVAYVTGRGRGEEAARAADIHMVIGGAAAPLAEGDPLILSDSISHIPEAITVPRRGRKNLIIALLCALAVKLAVVVFAAVGLFPLWFCVMIDACETLALILVLSYINNKTA